MTREEGKGKVPEKWVATAALRAAGLLEAVELASRRPLEAPRHRKVGRTIEGGGGEMYITSRLGNQNENSV